MRNRRLDEKVRRNKPEIRQTASDMYWLQCPIYSWKNRLAEHMSGDDLDKWKVYRSLLIT
jgi:hypothetical protein